MMNKELVKQDYETMYKQKEAENRYLNMQLEEQGKCYENRIYDMKKQIEQIANDEIEKMIREKVNEFNRELLSKYEKENKWLKDIINSILHI